MATTVTAEWIAVDWGTSNLRAWAMDRGEKPLAMRESDAGMGRLKPDQFEDALLALVGGWLDEDRITNVLACGMVGARQGWMEADYRGVPCPPAGSDALLVPGTDPRIRVSILPGLMQEQPADVMRGEETQIAGYLADNPDFEGNIVLPGTHSKWVRIAGGEVVGFSTYMSGEVFGLLAKQSVLRHSVAGDGWDADAFKSSLRESLAEPAAAMGGLFRLRAESLLHGLAPDAARARLSGIVLGLELAAAREHWEKGPVVVIGASGLGKRYTEAIEVAGGKAEQIEGEGMTLAGLVSAYNQLYGGST